MADVGAKDLGESASVPHYDAVVVGSGFGGSVAALRLSEKGYRVLVIEKGRRFARGDFPKSNWCLPRWLWMPGLGFRGPFKMTFMRHLTVFSGVGVGGGSLVYANTLPIPKRQFFTSGSWAALEDWEATLQPHYATARRMLGVAKNPRMTVGDEVLLDVAKQLGREDHFEVAEVGVFFGESGKEVPDPYFDGKGPPRTGCTHCGGCMVGCRVGAKNTLDLNYLYLAERLGCEILADSLVTAVRPRSGSGYLVEARRRRGWFRRDTVSFTADRVVLAGGVLGTVELLLAMRSDPAGLPNLSPRTGDEIRTNSESLIAVVSGRRDLDLSEGVAITSILHTDDQSHVEPVRYPRGSGFFRTMVLPHAPGSNALVRFGRALAIALRQPLRFLRAVLVSDFARFTQVLLYMRSMEGTLKLVRRCGVLRRGGQLQTSLAEGAQPTAFIPEATDVARRFADGVDGVPMSLVSEVALGIPSTAHILGGACMGAGPDEGVIDSRHEVHGYPDLLVVDGAAVSSNPGVNPSLTITALAERAMSLIPRKDAPAPTTS